MWLSAPASAGPRAVEVVAASGRCPCCSVCASEGYYYSITSKRAQRQEGALRRDKSRVGIKMPKLITSARGQ